AQVFQVEGGQNDVGVLSRGMLFSVDLTKPSLNDFRISESATPTLLHAVSLCFTAGFPGAFKSREQEAQLTSAVRNEGGRFALLNRQADWGTRFAAVFTNVPEGVRVFVTVWDEDANSLESATAVLVQGNDPSGAGGIVGNSWTGPVRTVNGVPLAEIGVN